MAVCCPKTFTGFCLEDNTPIAITIDNGVVISWTNLVTGVVSPGNPPAGTGICEAETVVTIDIEPLTCAKDSITICPGADPIPVTFDGTISVALDCATDSVTICPGADPIEVFGVVTVNQGTSPWVSSLDAATLAALETVTVLQGTTPWVVSGTVSVTEPVTVDAVDLDIRNLDCATDSIEVCQGTSPWVVDGEVSLDAATLAALETVTVLQGTTPWVVSGTALDVRPLDCATDSVEVCQGTSPWVVSENPDIPDLTGTWAYEAGVAGTEIIGAGQRVIGIAAHAGIVAGSMTINGGDVIPVPANSSITINPYGQLVAPTIVFTGTDSYFIETLI